MKLKIKVLEMLRTKPSVLFMLMATHWSLCSEGGDGSCCLISVELVEKRMEMDGVAGAHLANTEGTDGTRCKSELPPSCDNHGSSRNGLRQK